MNSFSTLFYYNRSIRYMQTYFSFFQHLFHVIVHNTSSRRQLHFQLFQTSLDIAAVHVI